MAKIVNKKSDIQLTSISGKINKNKQSASSLKSETKPNLKSKSKIQRSPAFHIFSQSIQRSKNLLKIHDLAHGKKAKPEKYLSDIHRAAVVLAISAMDAFICKFITTKISDLLSDDSKEPPGPLLNKIREVTEKPKHTLIIDAVRKNNIRQLIEDILQEEYEKKIFQGTDSIERCMNIVGYKNVFKTIASKAKLNEDDMKNELNNYTKRRHIIVHRGDFDINENPPKTENTITKTYAKKCISLIEKIAKQINELK